MAHRPGLHGDWVSFQVASGQSKMDSSTEDSGRLLGAWAGVSSPLLSFPKRFQFG